MDKEIEQLTLNGSIFPGKVKFPLDSQILSAMPIFLCTTCRSPGNNADNRPAAASPS